MTWKSTAAAGAATIAATWLASHAPVSGPARQRETRVPVDRTEAAAIDIQREADRLHSRLAEVGAYREPARNPFRFKPRAAPLVPPVMQAEPAAAVDEAPMAPPPPALRMTLAGIAESVVEGQTVRTAIISAAGDVWLVKAGDPVGSHFTVGRVGADFVELVPIEAGAPLRLALKP
jgi:hypothetical protein